MSQPGLSFVFLGLSITSSWGNGHATTYRALLRELSALGHDVLFLERDVPWYRDNRDLPHPPFARTVLYAGLQELADRHGEAIRDADVVVVGSYVPQGRLVCSLVHHLARGVTAFYDIDTPVTMRALAGGTCEYLAAHQVPRFDLYLSFTGGPTLAALEKRFGARRARALYCSVDPTLYRRTETPRRWLAGYLGTFSEDRQPGVERLLLAPARQRPGEAFVVAGPMYPEAIGWPQNIERLFHVPPSDHPLFYARQAFTVNVTRADMIHAGYSPSVRLFEAAACGTPIITDPWEGLSSFFEPSVEILVARNTAEALRHMALPEERRRQVARRALARVLAEHTAAHRAATLETYARLALDELARARNSPRRQSLATAAEGAEADPGEGCACNRSRTA